MTRDEIIKKGKSVEGKCWWDWEECANWVCETAQEAGYTISEAYRMAEDLTDDIYN